MINEQTDVNQVTNEKLNAAAKALGKAILNSEEYNNFIKARDQFKLMNLQRKLQENTIQCLMTIKCVRDTEV